MALVYLFASDDAEVVGIASTAGNVPVQRVCENNLGLLELCRMNVPVSKGSERPLVVPLRTAEDTHGPKGMGYAQLPSTDRELTTHDAADAWIRAARAYPGELVAIAVGPLTNLALAMRRNRRCRDCYAGWSSWAAHSTTAATPHRWRSGTSAWIRRPPERSSPCGVQRGG